MPNTVLWMMNTGYVAGSTDDGIKIKIKHSSAMLEAMLANDIVWKVDPDFGYEIVDVDHSANAALVEYVPREILNPVLAVDPGVYQDWVERMKKDRVAFLESHNVDPEIISTI